MIRLLFKLGYTAASTVLLICCCISFWELAMFAGKAPNSTVAELAVCGCLALIAVMYLCVIVLDTIWRKK